MFLCTCARINTNLLFSVSCLFPVGAGMSCDFSPGPAMGSPFRLCAWLVSRTSLSHQDGIVADESQNMPFMSGQSMKLPPSNSALPNQALGSIAGLGMQNLNSVRQVSPLLHSRLCVACCVCRALVRVVTVSEPGGRGGQACPHGPVRPCRRVSL